MFLSAGRRFVWIALLSMVAPLTGGVAVLQAQGLMLAGQVIPSDSGTVDGLQLRVQAGSFMDSTRVDPYGEFSIELPESSVGDTVVFVVDAVEVANRRYYPALARLQAGELHRRQDLILVPLRWTISAGRLAGTTVAVSPNRAFAPACRYCPAFYRRTSSVVRSKNAAGLPIWPVERFPLRVAFDHAQSDEIITARDSVFFWRIADRLQTDFGAALFQPVRYDEALSSDDEITTDVVVWIVSNLRLEGRGGIGFYGEEVILGTIWLKNSALISSTHGPTIVAHELMHALGFGHTCSWHSVLADPTRCAWRKSGTLTPEDIAYVQLAHRVSTLAWHYQARWGIEAALEGERVYLLGLPPGGASPR